MAPPMLNNRSFAAPDEGYSDDEEFKTGPSANTDHSDFDQRMRRRHSTTRSPSHLDRSQLGARGSRHEAAGGQVMRPSRTPRQRNPFEQQPPTPRQPQSAHPMDTFHAPQTPLPPYHSPLSRPNPFDSHMPPQMPAPYEQYPYSHPHNSFQHPPQQPPPQPGHPPPWGAGPWVPPHYDETERPRRPRDRQNRRFDEDLYEEQQRRRQGRERQLQQQRRAKAKAKQDDEVHRRETALKDSITKEVKELLDGFSQQQQVRQSSDHGMRGLVDLFAGLALNRDGRLGDASYASQYQRPIGASELEHRIASVERYMAGHNQLQPAYPYHSLPPARALLDHDLIQDMIIKHHDLARSVSQMKEDLRSSDGSFYHAREPLAIPAPPSTTSSRRRRSAMEPEVASQVSDSTRRSRRESVYGDSRPSVDFLKVPGKRLDRLDKEYHPAGPLDMDGWDDDYYEPVDEAPTRGLPKRLRGTRRAPPVVATSFVDRQDAQHFAPPAGSRKFAQRMRPRTPYIEEQDDSDEQAVFEEDQYEQQPKAPRRPRRATDANPMIIKVRSQPATTANKSRRQSVHGTVQIEAGSDDEIEDDEYGNYTVTPKRTRQTPYAFDHRALERRFSHKRSQEMPRKPAAPSLPPN